MIQQETPTSILPARSFEERVSTLHQIFSSFSTPSDRYNYLIELGKGASQLEVDKRTPMNLVRGCQSELYLDAVLDRQDIVRLSFYSQSLVSAGLAALLLYVYDGLTPKEILNSTPDFLKDLGVINSLSPNRSQGLVFIYLKIRNYATIFGQ